MTTRPGLLFAFCMLAALTAACAPPADYTPGARAPEVATEELEGAADSETSDADELTLEQLLNATYQLPDGMEFTLEGGVYQEESEGASMTTNVTLVEDLVAFGDLNDDGVGDAAVVLVDSPGGSGIFGYLAAVVNDGGEPVNLDTVELGDRTRLHANMIEDLVILLDVTAHDDDDPLCCPTLDATWQYMLEDDSLVRLEEPSQDDEEGAGATETDEPATEEAVSTRTPRAVLGRRTPTPEADRATGPDNEPAELTGTVWEWQTTQMSDGSDFTPEDPSDYTVEFNETGDVAIQADCNRAVGSYSERDGALEIVVGPMTMAACPEGSLSSVFVSQLTSAAGAFMRGDDLFMDLKFDSGTMQFAPGE